MVVRAALRLGFGTASLLAGSWALRALHGAPAALGASPAEIAVTARRSPNFRDGSFVNVDPASGISLDREEQRRSFAFGNTAFENELITREMVDREAEKLAREADERRA